MKKYKTVLTVLGMGILLGMTACGGAGNTAKEENTFVQENSDSGDKDLKDAETPEVESKENGVETVGSKQENDGCCVVTGGYQFTLPENLSPTVNDQGLILTDENMNYQMLVTVRDYNFNNRKAEKESFAENVRAADYEITRDVDIVTVAEREYAYFNYIDEDGSNMLLAYSYADEEHTFANLVLRYGDLSDEEILTEIAELLATAEETEAPDTTLDDIVLEKANQSGESGGDVSGYASAIDEIEVTIGEHNVTASVPENFYIMNFSKEEEDSNVKCFVSTDDRVEVTLMGLEDCYAENVEAWVKSEIEIPEDGKNISVSEVQTEQVGDVTVSYQMGSYEMVSSYSGKSIIYLVLEAIGELPDGGYLEVQAEATEADGLNFDMVKDFFEIKK